MVVKIDGDAGQKKLMPLFFVSGLKTRVRSILGLESLRKSEMTLTSFERLEDAGFLNKFEEGLEAAYHDVLICQK